jgi:hypothetical protein
MKAIECIAFQVMGEFSCLSYSGYYGELMRLYAEFGHGVLKCLQDAEVAASGTPRRILSFIII